ncbi:CYFA0S20e01948g1_1 [Cyberlindnera fabianii]|uniref:CYFA0S20e01948g1_1 n=1 Tax=Cyberlindnera fabianii TaxID=36022 RepID=A0A061BG31_CYBFA|nr:CYFA0S20e01948g1_1 [Cyberlindnera fabianii]
MLFKPLSSILVLLQGYAALADVSISKPKKGSSYSASGGSASVEVTWIESNATPKLSDISSYTFKVCTGPNNDIECSDPALKKVDAKDVDGYSITLSIPSTVGADGSYYIQVYAQAEDLGYTIHYTERFTLEDMTGGTLKPSGEDETSPPDAQTSVNGGDDTTTIAASDLSKSFSVYYTSQTGKTRYAPMQTQPGSTITASTWTRRFPTSAVTYYTSLSTSLAQVSTITPGWDYTISSAVNWASHAPHPSENGGWYNPSSRVSSATLSLTQLSSGSDSDSSTSST